MKLTIKPEKVVVKPAVYSVSFYESRDYDGYVGGDNGYETMNDFRPDISTWLDENAPGWSAEFDRGDWGEGPAVVKINFASEDQATAFFEKFNAIPCSNALSRMHCESMNKAVLDARSHKNEKSKCQKCGYEIVLFNFGDETDE